MSAPDELYVQQAEQVRREVAMDFLARSLVPGAFEYMLPDAPMSIEEREARAEDDYSLLMHWMEENRLKLPNVTQEQLRRMGREIFCNLCAFGDENPLEPPPRGRVESAQDKQEREARNLGRMEVARRIVGAAYLKYVIPGGNSDPRDKEEEEEDEKKKKATVAKDSKAARKAERKRRAAQEREERAATLRAEKAATTLPVHTNYSLPHIADNLRVARKAVAMARSKESAVGLTKLEEQRTHWAMQAVEYRSDHWAALHDRIYATGVPHVPDERNGTSVVRGTGQPGERLLIEVQFDDEANMSAASCYMPKATIIGLSYMKDVRKNLNEQLRFRDHRLKDTKNPVQDRRMYKRITEMTRRRLRKIDYQISRVEAYDPETEVVLLIEVQHVPYAYDQMSTKTDILWVCSKTAHLRPEEIAARGPLKAPLPVCVECKGYILHTRIMTCNLGDCHAAQLCGARCKRVHRASAHPVDTASEQQRKKRAAQKKKQRRKAERESKQSDDCMSKAPPVVEEEEQKSG